MATSLLVSTSTVLSVTLPSLRPPTRRTSAISPIDVSVPFRLLGGSPQLGTASVALRIRPKRSRLSELSASAGESVVEKAQELVPAAAPPAGEGLGPVIISSLINVALVSLSLLTIGVIYLAVTDFLRKREREKLDKEEAAKMKKGKKKSKVKARAGPRGFGQKIEDVGEEEV